VYSVRQVITSARNFCRKHLFRGRQ